MFMSYANIIDTPLIWLSFGERPRLAVDGLLWSGKFVTTIACGLALMIYHDDQYLFSFTGIPFK